MEDKKMETTPNGNKVKIELDQRYTLPRATVYFRGAPIVRLYDIGGRSDYAELLELVDRKIRAIRGEASI